MGKKDVFKEVADEFKASGPADRRWRSDKLYMIDRATDLCTDRPGINFGHAIIAVCLNGILNILEDQHG